MAAPISPMQLLVSIVERGKGRCLLDHYRQFGLIHHNQAGWARHCGFPFAGYPGVWDQRAGCGPYPGAQGHDTTADEPFEGR